jgi:restriction endonuclease S subunit
MGNCFLVNGKFYPSDHIFILKINKILNIKYIYSLIQTSANIIKQNSNGSIIDGISKEALSNIKIKIPVDLTLITKLEPLFEKVEVLQRKIKKSESLYKQYIEELSNEAIIN